jgi:hypothetical protein
MPRASGSPILPDRPGVPSLRGPVFQGRHVSRLKFSRICDTLNQKGTSFMGFNAGLKRKQHPFPQLPEFR